MKINSILYFFGILFAFSLNSCNNEDNLSKSDQPICNKQDILSFKNEDEFKETLKKIEYLNDLDREKWELAIGFNSYGFLCDEIFDNVNPKDFKTLDEIKEFVNVNSTFIELYKDANGELYCVPKELENNERFLMNKDKMYIVGETVYKKFDKGFVTTKIENIEKLRGVSIPEEIISNPGYSFHCTKRAPFLKSINLESYERTNDVKIGSDTYRLSLWVQTEDYMILDPLNLRTDRETEYTLTNYARWLGVWWARSYNTSYNIYLESSDYTTNKSQVIDESAVNVSIKSRNISRRMLITEGITTEYSPYFSYIQCTASNAKGCKVSL